MSTDEQYNGWTNRETWAVALHINNDQGWQESVRTSLRELLSDHLSTDTDDDSRASASREAGEIIRENVEDVFDVETYGTLDSPEDCQNFVKRTLPVMTDIGSLHRVNWTELGSSFLSDMEEVDSDS